MALGGLQAKDEYMKVKVGSFKKQVRASNDKGKPAGEPSLQDTPPKEKVSRLSALSGKKKEKTGKPINQQFTPAWEEG